MQDKFLNVSRHSPTKYPSSSSSISTIIKPRNGTIKSFAEAIKLNNEPIIFRHEGQSAPPPENNVTFDFMANILAAKKIKVGSIFLIDNDAEALLELIKLVRTVNSESVKLGVLFRIDGHTTPFCIEKIVCDEDDSIVDSQNLVGDEIVVYHTDSVVMDIDQGAVIRNLVAEISLLVPIYSLGHNDPKGIILRDYKRQSDEYSCAVYALFDVEQMMNMDFYEFALARSKKTAENLFTLDSLPPIFMATIQSVAGKEQEGTVIRNGLEYYINNHPKEANQEMRINGEKTSLKQISREIKEQNIGNPIVAIMSQYYYELYKSNISNDIDESVYKLTKSNLEDNRNKIENQIFDLAVEQFENGSQEPEVTTAGPKHHKEGRSLIGAIALTIGVIVLGIIYFQNKYGQQSSNTPSKHSKNKIGEGNTSVAKHDFESTSDYEANREDDSLSDDELKKSAFGQGSFTARVMQRRQQEKTNSRDL